MDFSRLPERVKNFLQRFFDTTDHVQHDWSERWREHTNRRTLIASVIIGATVLFAYLLVIQPPEEFPAGQLVSVPSGMTLSEMARTLEEQNVVRSPLAFQVLTKIIGRERTAQAGDYLFKEPKSLITVVRAISTGAFGLEPVRIRIPEGATTRSMAIIYKSQLERFNAEKFLAQAQPLEGYLFPDTYYLLPNATEDTVIEAMRQNFDAKIAEIIPPIASSTKRSFSDVITMASILEREAHNSDDRRKIAGVLWNRIDKGMPLQVDAAFLYTLGKSTFQLTIEDLKTDSPYNTYVNKGLPPTPIGSPSLDSILAAANPIKNNFLFYLADSSGVTHYSRTYQEHLRLKALYID